jgi:fibronectin-binding autotransporter adhesin
MAIITPTQTIVSVDDPFSTVTTSTANPTVINASSLGGLNTGSLALSGAADKSVIIAGLTATETNYVTVDTVSIYNTDKDIYITGVDQRSFQQVLNVDEPGGSNGQIQFNDNGDLGGDDTFAYNKNTNTLTVANLTVSETISMPDITKLSIAGGTAGQVLLTKGGGQVYWGNTSGTGTVTSVGFDTGVTGLTVSSSTTNPITSSGNFTLDGVLNIEHGGTGLTIVGSPNSYLKVNSAGTALEFASTVYTLPTAGTGQNSALGGVRVDGTSILINPMGVISSYASVVYTATAQSTADGAIIRLTGSDTDGTHISSVKLKAGANMVINRLDTQTIEISSTGGGGGSTGGTVTSVGLSMPTGFTVTGSPITAAGTLAVSTSLNGIVAGNGTGFTTVTVGSGLSYSNGTLSATGGGGGGGSGTVTSVGGTGTVNGLTLTGTITTSGNLTLGGSLSNILNSALANSSITINGTAVALGGSRTITLADLGGVAKTGDTMSGPLTLNANPTASLQAATKQYVDNLVSGLFIKEAARVATQSNISGTYTNGTNGVGAKLTGSGPLDTISGLTVNVGDRVLVKNQTTKSQNGIYLMTASNPFELTRAIDFNNSLNMNAGDAFFVGEGTLATTQWIMTTTGAINTGTTDVEFTQFGGPGTYTGGTGIEVNGTTISNKGVLSVTGSGAVSATTVNGAVTLGFTQSTVPTTSGGTGLTNIGTANQVLRVNSAGTALEWGTVTGGGSGTVTSVGLSMPTGFTVSNSPVTSSGNIAVSTTLNGIVAGNGSGFTTVTVGSGLSYSNGTLSATGGGGSGTVTSVGGTGTVNGLTLTGTVTGSGNITLGGSLSNIPNTALTNNSITINSTTIALGSSTTFGLNNLNQVTITSPTNGQVLKYNGSNWVNSTDATGDGGSGTVTSVGGTGTVNGLTLTGTVTSSGSLTLGGTLSGISNSALTNSSVTFNGRSASLGGSATINLADLGTVTITSPSNGQVLKYNGTAWVNSTDATGGGGSGTVTAVSVTSANGFGGTVSNSTTTPAITLTTSVNGLLKGNGTGVSAASAGTDYQAPITLTTTGSSGPATFSNGTLNIPQYSGGGGSGGGAGNLSRFAVEIYYDGSGNLAGTPTILAGTGTAVYTTVASTACEVTFTFTGYSSPPLSILYYGIQKSGGAYNIRSFSEGTSTKLLVSGTIGTNGSGTAFSAFNPGIHTMKLSLTKSATGTNGTGATSAVIEFVMFT